MENKRIFTFWEPKNKIPAYLELCIETWKKFLPDYKIIILNYSNLNYWLRDNFYPEILFEKYSKTIQSDAIRCAILNKYGGIWFDIDTIILSNSIEKIFDTNTQFLLINEHIAFIKAKKNALILNKWQKGILRHLKISNFFYKKIKLRPLKTLFNIYFYKYFYSWDCLGNKILKDLLKIKNKNIFYKLNSKEINALPELINKNTKLKQFNLVENYVDFYFKNDNSKFILNNNKIILLLHNSWTPDEYKKMSKEEFLNHNNTLSNLLKYILN